MSKDNYIPFEGQVLQSRGNNMFTVKIDDTEQEVLCTLSGKIRKNSIKIIEGDKVKIGVCIADTTRGIINYRSKR
jgi:translation initiation factor IF-1